MPSPLQHIPYLGLPDAPIVSSSWDFLPIADICNDIIIFKDGSAALIMESTSLNFSLLSEKEQQAVIFAYGALLNSLSFPIQVVVRSQVKDISKYLDYLQGKINELKNPLLVQVANNYKNFVETTVKKRNVLGKTFYLVIPFSSLELGVTKSVGALTKRKGPLPFPRSYVVKKAKISLYPKRDHLIRQAGRLGLRLKQLPTTALINLSYNLFNSEPPTIKKDELSA